MVTVFVDTSALMALAAGDDTQHSAAAATFRSLGADVRLITHEYVLVETISLLQRRSGVAAVRGLSEGLLPILETRWIDPELHARARDALLGAGRRSPSFVDHTSFLVMRDEAIRTAFTFDQEFAQQGFEVIPG